MDNEIKTKSENITRFGKIRKESFVELKYHCSFIDFNNFKNLIDKLNSNRGNTVELVHERKQFNLGVLKTEELKSNNVVFN